MRMRAGKDRILSVDGFRLRVRAQGPAEAPPVVLVHGFAQSLETWDGWADDLARDHRVVRCDLPGHGLSGPDAAARYSNEETVDALDALLAVLKLERPVIAGSSLGGLVAWRYAARPRRRVRGLVLLAPGGFPMNGVGDRPASVPGAMEAYLRLAPAPVVREATRAMYGDPDRLHEDRLAMVVERMSAPGVGEALVDRLERFTLPDPEPVLARVAAPSLLMWGEKDTVVPVDHAPRFAAALKRVETRIYDDLGHLPHEEAPERTLEDVRGFIARLRR